MNKQRVVTFDIIRGIGIIFFITWHVFINFTSNEIRSESEIFRMVFFITAYFVFSSGFITGSHYYNKLKNGGDWILIFNRVCVRSFKLMMMVVLAGVAIKTLSNGYMDYRFIYQILNSIVTLLYIDRWDISLQVLIVISMTIITGVAMLYFINKNKIFLLITTIILILIMIADIFRDGYFPYLWRYYYYGIAGVISGVIFNDKKDYHISSKYYLSLGVFLSILFISVLIFISKKPFAHYHDLWLNSLAIYLFFPGFGLLFFSYYELRNKEIKSVLVNILSITGRNSLFVYIMQITVIDLIAHIFSPVLIHSQWILLFDSILIFLFCGIFTMVTEILRKNELVDYLYRSVFN